MANCKLTHKYLLSILDYKKNTGIFVWKVGRRKGQVAGCYASQGRKYFQITIDGKKYYNQILAWFYVTGKMPKHEIDHKNRNSKDNRFVNLREADDIEQARNHGKYKSYSGSSCSSKYKGVRWSKDRARWKAVITINNKQQTIGYFLHEKEAAVRYDEKAFKEFGVFAVLNFSKNERLNILKNLPNGKRKEYKGKGCSSQYYGVCFNKRNKKWQSNLYVNKKLLYLGCFLTEKEAAIAHDKAALKLLGNFARLNFLDSLKKNQIGKMNYSHKSK